MYKKLMDSILDFISILCLSCKWLTVMFTSHILTWSSSITAAFDVPRKC